MATITDIINWTSTFRQSRHEIAIGRPLWAYKVTDAELHDLQTLLADLAYSQGIHNVINRYEGAYSEVFVLFASTWLQRNNTGRPTWGPLLDAIHAKGMDQADRMSLVEQGLRKWGLNVYSTDTSFRFLDSLACHGGFPRSDLLRQSVSHIMAYFEAVLDRYERYQYFDTLEEIAEEQLQKLPITLQQRAFSTLVTQLIERLIEWKSQYDLGAYRDAILVLDSENPEWRKELPFLVLDEEAETLIDKLLKRVAQSKRRELNPIRIKRQLIQVDDNYRLVAEIYIAREIHPEDLTRQLGGGTLPTSIFLSTNTSDNNRIRTASLSMTSGANSGWKVSTYHTQLSNAVAADELEFSLESDGRQLLSGTYYRGEALEDGVPWIFEPTGSVASYIGQGGLQSNRDRLIIVSRQQPKPITPISTAKYLGGLISTSLKVFEVTGEVLVDGLSGHYLIKCNSGTSEEMSVRIENGLYEDLKSKYPIYIGVPDVNCVTSAGVAPIEHSELYWYQSPSKTLKPLHSKGVLGEGIIVWRRAQTVLWEKPIIILPPHFEYQLTHIENTEFNLLLRNAMRPKVGLGAGYESWFSTAPRHDDDELSVVVQPKETDAQSFTITLMWDDDPDTECQLEIPIAYNAAGLVDRNGVVYRELEMGDLTVNELSNLRVRIRTKIEIETVQVVALLMGKPRTEGNSSALLSHHLEIKVDCKRGLSVLRGSDISELVARLFTMSDELDTSVELQFYSNGTIIPNTLPVIKRYKHDPKFPNDPYTAVLKATPTLRSTEAPKLYMSPIWDLGREPIEVLPKDLSANLWNFTLPQLGEIEYGDWLIWAEPIMSVHPRLRNYPVPVKHHDPEKLGALGAQLLQVFNNKLEPVDVYKETLVPGSLAYKVKYLVPSNRDSMKALNKSVRNLGFDIDHKSWSYIDGVMKRINSIEPLALFAMTAMQRNPGALAMLLFRDRKNFQQTWQLANKLGFSWYLIPIPIWVSVIRQYFEKYQSQAEPLRELDEEIYWEMVYKPFAEFEAKGPYFKYLIDISTDRKCYEAVAIWKDVELEKIGADDQTVGALFRRERSALFDRHSGQFMSRVGTKKTSQYFLKELEENFPTLQGLHTSLFGFVKYTIAEDCSYDTKQDAWILTMRLPLQVGWYVSGVFERPRHRKFLLRLRNAITLLDGFDREWLQQAMIVSHMAYNILESDDITARAKEQT